MTQYHYLDESGDPAVTVASSSSSHFVLAMVQLAERTPIEQLAAVREVFHLPPTFEFKYHTTTAVQKRGFFDAIEVLPFRVRIAVITKLGLPNRYVVLRGQDFAIEFAVALTLRASELDIADDVLIVDGATPAFLRALRLRLSGECRRLNRVRPFRKIVSGDSKREDGLQLADMIAGASRHYTLGSQGSYSRVLASKIADWWEVPVKEQ